MKLILIVMLFSTEVFALAPRTKDALTTEIKEGEVIATLKEGYHFNEKAPNTVTVDDKSIKPTRMTARETAFAGLPEKYTTAKAALYICDDAVTFCETQFVDLKGKSTKSSGNSSGPKNRGKVNKHGFIEDDFNKALLEARKKNQPLLVDFSARWCPGCLRLEKEMFPTKEFKALTKDFVKVKIDTDRFENGVVSEKYGVRAIPTLLVINAEQEEIDRVVDFQPIEVLEPFFKEISANPTTLKELTTKAESGDQKIVLQLGKRLLAAGRAEASLNYLGKIQPAPPELIDAQIQAATQRAMSDKNEDKQLEKLLRQAIKSEPESVRSLGWRGDLMVRTKDAKEKLKIKDEGLAVAEALLASPEKLKAAMIGVTPGEFTGFEAMMIIDYKVDLISESGASTEVIEAELRKSARTGLDLKIPTDKVGPNIRLLTLLLMAKMYEDADKLSTKLMKVDPNNPELQRRRLNVLVKMKKYNEAIVLGRKVVKNSYGRNEFWAAELLAKAYVESERLREAQVFIDNYLSRSEIDWPKMALSRQALEDLRKKLPKE